MGTGAKVEKLYEVASREAKAHGRRLLAQVTHDLKTPLSTIGMEMFSAKVVLERLARTSAGETAGRRGSADETAEVERDLRELMEICVNLERATLKLADYVAALSALSRPRDETGP